MNPGIPTSFVEPNAGLELSGGFRIHCQFFFEIGYVEIISEIHLYPIADSTRTSPMFITTVEIGRDREHMVSLIFVNQAEIGNSIQTSLSIAITKPCLFAYLTGVSYIYAGLFFKILHVCYGCENDV